VIVEIKAVSKLTDEHRAQLLNYLNATGYEVGLLVNFGHYPKLEYERFVNQKKRPGPNA
jgi:GxxExxY protein